MSANQSTTLTIEERFARHMASSKAVLKRYRESHREQINERQRAFYHANIANSDEFRRKRNEKSRLRYQQLKAQMTDREPHTTQPTLTPKTEISIVLTFRGTVFFVGYPDFEEVTPEYSFEHRKITIQSETSAVYLISNSSGGYDYYSDSEMNDSEFLHEINKYSKQFDVEYETLETLLAETRTNFSAQNDFDFTAIVKYYRTEGTKNFYKYVFSRA